MTFYLNPYFTSAPVIPDTLPQLPFQDNIVFISGQSNSESADSSYMKLFTGSSMVVMLDAARPRHFLTTYGLNGFTNLANAEYIDTQTHWGGDMAPWVGLVIEQLVMANLGVPFATHGKRIIPVHIGQSSSDVPEFSFGSAVFTQITNWCTAAKAAATTAGRTIGVIGGAWLWGARAYDDAMSQATVESRIHNYWKIGGDVDVYLLSIFGQQGTNLPVGIFGSHAHIRATGTTLTTVADAEANLIATYPTKYSMVNGEGQFHLNGRIPERSRGGSSIHHAALENVLIGAHIGWWVYEKIMVAHTWPNMIPGFTRTSSTQIKATFDAFPSGGFGDFEPTGLYPRLAQINHGWFFYDPAAPTVELALTRPPYWIGSEIFFDFVSTLPTNVSVRYGTRTTAIKIAGNERISLTSPITITVEGTSYDLWRNLPAFTKVVA